MENNDKPLRGRPIEWTEERALKLIDDLIEWLKTPDLENLYIKKFLFEQDQVDPTVISYLNKKYKSFEKKYDLAKEIQESKIVTASLNSRINSTMSVFFLKNKHNWKDKQDIELSGDATFRVVFGSDASKEEDFNDGESESN